MRKLLFFLMTCCTASVAYCYSIYNSCYNEFAGLKPHTLAVINDKFLQLENTTSRNIYILDSTAINNYQDFKYYIRFANLHNNEGKSYKVTDNKSKSHHKVTSTRCGIVFLHTPSSFWTATASCSNTDLYNEIVDRRSMTIELSKVTNGEKEIKKRVIIEKDINLDDGLNYLCAQLEGTTIKVKAGKESLNDVISYALDDNDIKAMQGIKMFKVGIIAGPGALLSLERTVLQQRDPIENTPINLESQWTKERLDRHFEQSKNPYEGYWTYLDRDMEDKWLKIGGRYTIALVETPTGYDVIYIDGAQVKKSQWHLGMRKAEMTKTIFTDNFTAKWNDATFEPIELDVYATFESGVILTFKFPVYKSQIRFSKVLQ